MGFGLVIGFVEHLQIVTTSNYSSNANSLPQQFTTARTRFSVCCVFTSRCLVTIPTMSSASVLTLIPGGDYPTSNSFRITVSLRLAVYRQSVHLGDKTLEVTTNNFFQLNTCGHSPYITSSLSRSQT
jgi:hypothetical protein